MATTKTLTPTNQAITLADFTEKPDNRTNVTNDEKLADAINTLNSNTALTITQYTNSHIDTYSRIFAVKRGNMLYFLGNITAKQGDGFSDFEAIGKIEGWDAVYDSLATVCAQSDGSKVLIVSILANGTIRLYSGTGLTTGIDFYRCSLCVPAR